MALTQPNLTQFPSLEARWAGQWPRIVPTGGAAKATTNQVIFKELQTINGVPHKFWHRPIPYPGGSKAKKRYVTTLSKISSSMKSPLRIWVKDNGKMREIDNGPFAIEYAQLLETRRQFAAEFEQSKPLQGAQNAPQTTARDILSKVAPHLSDFDRLMLGFAVTNDTIKVQSAAQGGGK